MAVNAAKINAITRLGLHKSELAQAKPTSPGAEQHDGDSASGGERAKKSVSGVP